MAWYRRWTAPRVSPVPKIVGGFLWIGVLLGAYRGLVALGVGHPAAWVGWSHVHYVTVGGFVLLLFGTLPRYVAWKLDRPVPSPLVFWTVTVAVVGAFLTIWAGRVMGFVAAYDAGLVVLWAATAGLLGWLVHAIRQSDPPRRDGSVWLVIAAVISFLWGLTIAWGLYGQSLPAPGGWTGLREAHIHANAWGFVGLSVIAIMFDGYPRLVGAEGELPGRRPATLLLALGIGPLIVGPWLDAGQTVTVVGLLLYTTGFLGYLHGMVFTYRSGRRTGPGLWILLAHGWLITPVGFAPAVIYGGLPISPVVLERTALHFFFLGWLLPVALVGLFVACRQSPVWTVGHVGVRDIDRVVSRRLAVGWHAGVLLLGAGLLLPGIGGRLALTVGTVAVVAGWGLVLLRTGALGCAPTADGTIVPD